MKPGPTEVDRCVGERLVALRKAKGLSQNEVGAAIGVTFQQIQKYERGTNRISAGRLRTLATLLEVPVSAFFEEAEGGDGDFPLSVLRLHGAGDLLHAYASLTPELRQVVLTLARDLARTSGRPELVS